VGLEIVGDDDLALPEGGCQDVADVHPSKRTVVIAPSNRSRGPTPSRGRDATTVLFSPRLAGAVA